MKTAPYENLNHPSIQLGSLVEITNALHNAQFGVHNGKRCFQIGDIHIPVKKVVDAILVHRPPFWDASEIQLSSYFYITKKFKELLPQESKKSIFGKISGCFWGCLYPSYINCCVCTPACKEKLVISDAEMSLEGVRRWKQSVAGW